MNAYTVRVGHSKTLKEGMVRPHEDSLRGASLARGLCDPGMGHHMRKDACLFIYYVCIYFTTFSFLVLMGKSCL